MVDQLLVCRADAENLKETIKVAAESNLCFINERVYPTMRIALLLKHLQLHQFIHKGRGVGLIIHFQQIFNACKNIQTDINVRVAFKKLQEFYDLRQLYFLRIQIHLKYFFEPTCKDTIINAFYFS